MMLSDYQSFAKNKYGKAKMGSPSPPPSTTGTLCSATKPTLCSSSPVSRRNPTSLYTCAKCFQPSTFPSSDATSFPKQCSLPTCSTSTTCSTSKHFQPVPSPSLLPPTHLDAAEAGGSVEASMPASLVPAETKSAPTVKIPVILLFIKLSTEACSKLRPK